MRLFIYGAGRVGRSIARALQGDLDVQVTGAWNRSFAAALATSRVLPGLPVSSGDVLPEQLPAADVVLLSVVDDALAATAARLAPHLAARQVVLHTSGALPVATLRAPTTTAHLGGCHPLQSFASADGDPELIPGAVFAIEGDPDALDAARRLVIALRGEPLTLADPQARVFYHAAAVMAANYLTVLADAAATLHAHAGIDARTSARILAPLLHGTLDNLRRHTAASTPEDGRAAIARALTGPARRGDRGTISAHLKAIDRIARRDPDAADLPDLYRALLRRAAHMAARAGLDAEATQALLHSARRPEGQAPPKGDEAGSA